MTKDSNNRVWETLIKIGTALAWVCAGALITHEVRLSVIEASVYTQGDAIVSERLTTEKFNSLEHRLGEMGGDIKTILAILEERDEDE